MADGGLVPAILELCAAMGIEADRRNSGSLLLANRDGSRRSVKLCKPGTFDIFGYVQCRGYSTLAFEIECKSTTGKARAAQVARAQMLTRLGVPWIFARDIGDAKRFLECLRDGDAHLLDADREIFKLVKEKHGKTQRTNGQRTSTIRNGKNHRAARGATA